MNKPVLLAAVAAAAAALPVGALSQEGAAAPSRPGCTPRAEAPRADSALPARASTKPEPQLGTVAPSTRVPSHTVTPSSQAMAAATARTKKTDGKEKHATDACPGDPGSPSEKSGSARPEGS